MSATAPTTTTTTATPSATLTPALFKRLHPKPYLERFLAEQVRPDGRPSNSGEAAWREASVNLGSISTAPSSALVRLGGTTIVCGLTLEIAPPDITTPLEGFLVPNVDLPPLCSPLFRPGPPSDEAQVLSTRLRDILLSSNILPLPSLLIEPAKAAFAVYLDLVCLNYDGGILDAAVLACVGALRNLTLPKATWDPDTGLTTCEALSSPLGTIQPALQSAYPLCVSFGVFNGTLLPDPTLFETQLCQSHITIALLSSAEGTLLHVYQAGAPLQTPGLLKQCLALARKRAQELGNVLTA